MCLGRTLVLDLLADHGHLSQVDNDLRYNASSSPWSLLRIKNSQFAQRSRIWWLKYGDVTSSFFHASVETRRSRSNGVLALRLD